MYTVLFGGNISSKKPLKWLSFLLCCVYSMNNLFYIAFHSYLALNDICLNYMGSLGKLELNQREICTENAITIATPCFFLLYGWSMIHLSCLVTETSDSQFMLHWISSMSSSSSSSTWVTCLK